MSLTPVFEIPGTINFSGENDDFYNADHLEAMEVSRGAIALTFKPTDVSGAHALFSKDGRYYDDGGHLSAWVRDGRLEVRQQTDSESVHLKTDDLTIMKGHEHHLTVTFGQAGLKVYLDGLLILADPEIRQGLEENWREFLVGASGAHRAHDGEFPRDPFAGQITDLQLYDRQLDPEQVLDLASDALGASGVREAQHTLDVEALAPAFTQLHHGSDAARALAADYGLTDGHHGHAGHGGGHDGHGAILASLHHIAQGGRGDDAMDGGDERDAMNGGLGDDALNGAGGDDILQGDYGDDVLNGGGGRDILDGGHGNDVLNGGNGDDILIARSDAREPYVYEIPGRDEGDPFNELTNGKVHPDQPLPANDVLTGGDGADVFYIQTLINAKKQFIQEHTNKDGVINWHGVAGENDNIHDHWVDAIGHDVITDFSRAEGDRILIEGHTTEILSVTYGDADGDGAADHTIVEIYSQQGNGGGAHDEDRLGVLKIFGDLVAESDIEADEGPAYGVVKTIDGLSEALTPRHVSEDIGPIPAPADLDDGAPSDFVFFLVDTQTDESITQIRSGDVVSGDLIDTRAVSIMAAPVGMEAGSVRLRYRDHQQTENVSPYALFGDHNGDFKGDAAFGRGRTTIHVEAYEEEGGKGALLAFERLTFEVSDDAPAGAIGAGLGHNDAHDDEHDASHGHDDHDDGMDDATPVDHGDHAMDDDDAPEASAAPLERVTGSVGDDVLSGLDGAERLEGGLGDDVIRGRAGDDELFGGAGEDVLRGGEGDDVIEGGDGDDIATGDAGEDVIDGGLGDDVLKGRDDDDVIDGGDGEDVVVGGAGDDILRGGDDDDVVKGGAGDDDIDGGLGDDALRAGAGDDEIDGGEGGDSIRAGAGDDLILGGAGDDVLTGGGGLDIFAFGQASGSDVIRDFRHGEDTLDVSAYGFATADAALATISKAGRGVIVELSDVDDILIRKTTVEEFDASDFII